MTDLATERLTPTEMQPDRRPHGHTRGTPPWLRRTARALAPLLLFLAAALVQLYPYSSPDLTQHPEICWNTAGVLEARRAMAEGQFPARVANRQAFGPRYPIFQFYGALPYNGGGLLMAATGDRIGPYAALKLELWLVIACGGYFTYRMAHLLTRHRSASLLAGLVFITAPYLFCDVRARGAVSETMAMCLTPAALYATVRCYRSRKLLNVPLTAIAWTAVALAHNITYLYAVAFVALYMAPIALWGLVGVFRRPGRWRRVSGRFARLAAAGVIHGLLIAWYVVPSFLTADSLHVGYAGAANASPFASRVFTTLPFLAAPALSVHPESTTPFLGLQVGWPILASAGVAIGLLGQVLVARRAKSNRAATVRERSASSADAAGPLPHGRGSLDVSLDGASRRRLALAAAGVLLPFAAALLLTWSPVDVWRYVPRLFYYVQWSYRILVFVVVFGSVLAGVALAALFPRGGGGMRPAVIGLAILLLAMAAGSYVSDYPTWGPAGLSALYARPAIGILPDYLMSTAATSRTSWIDGSDNLAEPQWGLVAGDGTIRGGSRAVVPVPAGATGLVVEGDLADDQPAPVTISLTAGTRAVTHEARQLLKGGPFRVTVPVELVAHPAPISPGRPAGLATVVLNTAVGVDPGPAITPAVIHLRRVAWEGETVAPGPLPHSPPTGLRMTVRSGGRSTCSVEIDRPTRVALPVLYYPRLLGVRVDGKTVPYGNLGRFVAVEVPAGHHRIEVRFIGIGWANLASLVGVGAVAIMLAVGLLRRFRLRLPGRGTLLL